EVRSLAQRSADAAREIKSLIGESVERVNAGADVARGAGKTMEEIVSNVTRVSQLIGDIAAATTQQSSGIAQASQAVSELDKATQQNAALVEQSTAASEQLRQLAVEMADTVSFFRLGDASAAQPRLAPLTRASTPALARPAKALAVTAKRAATTTTVEEWKEF
ncbi:MAG: hypothetical protein H7Y14_10355, partial [Burkholderiales bacterium]|nr:hypothetical protein [Burkholderiales bacterium]